MSQQHAVAAHPAAFRRLWAAYSVSVFGDQVTLLAIPLAAVLTLHANALQMGLLTAAGTLPNLLMSLPAGVWIDRRRKRPLMVGADLLRLAVLLVVPGLAALHLLTLAALYAVQFVAGCGAVVGVIAASSFLPAVVGRGQLVEANSRLRGSDGVAQVAGPGLAGMVTQLVGAPFALLADAASFLFSAIVVGRMVRVPEPDPARRDGEPLRSQLAAGLRLTLGNPVLRAICGCAATINLIGMAVLAVLVLYATRTLGMSAGGLGVALGAGSIGAVLGAVVAAPLSRRFGLGHVTIAGEVVLALGSLALPFAGGPVWLATLTVLGGEFVGGFGVMLFDVNVGSLRQAITPDELLGRTASVGRCITQGARPIGALAGGALGVALGLRGTMLLAGGCAFLPLLWLIHSPLAAMRTLPAPVAEAVPPAVIANTEPPTFR